MVYLATKSVASVACMLTGEERRVLELSDCIRAETLKRLTAMPGYPYKPLKWKNRYYEYWKKRVMAEMGVV